MTKPDNNIFLALAAAALAVACIVSICRQTEAERRQDTTPAETNERPADMTTGQDGDSGNNGRQTDAPETPAKKRNAGWRQKTI